MTKRNIVYGCTTYMNPKFLVTMARFPVLIAPMDTAIKSLRGTALAPQNGQARKRHR